MRCGPVREEGCRGAFGGPEMGTSSDGGHPSPCFPLPLLSALWGLGWEVGAGKIGGLELGLVQRSGEGRVSDESSSGLRLPFPWLLCRAPWAPGLATGLREEEEPEAPHSPSCCSHFRSPRSLDLTGPLLLGGVPDLPESFPVRTRHFVGCMRNLQVDSRHVDMADFIANNGTVPGMGAGVGARPGALRREEGCACCGDPCTWRVSEPPPAAATGFLLGAST